MESGFNAIFVWVAKKVCHRFGKPMLKLSVQGIRSGNAVALVELEFGLTCWGMSPEVS